MSLKYVGTIKDRHAGHRQTASTPDPTLRVQGAGSGVSCCGWCQRLPPFDPLASPRWSQFFVWCDRSLKPQTVVHAGLLDPRTTSTGSRQ
jgi:hypothetical protein